MPENLLEMYKRLADGSAVGGDSPRDIVDDISTPMTGLLPPLLTGGTMEPSSLAIPIPPSVPAPIPTARMIQERPFACIEKGCSYRAPTQSRLRTHTLTHSVPEPMNHCDWPGCKFSAVQVGNLRSHRKTHLQERLFACDFPRCSYSAARRSNLKRHQLMHAMPRPFACQEPDCTFRAQSQSSLNAHLPCHPPAHSRERKEASSSSLMSMGEGGGAGAGFDLATRLAGPHVEPCAPGKARFLVIGGFFNDNVDIKTLHSIPFSPMVGEDDAALEDEYDAVAAISSMKFNTVSVRDVHHQ